MIFRDILFKIPKKYLVVIIVFLTIFIFKSNVFAYSDYDIIPTDTPAVDCVYYKYFRLGWNKVLDLHLEQNPSFVYGVGLDNNYWFQINYKAISNNNNYILFNLPNEAFRLERQSFGGGHAGIRLNLAGNNNILVDKYGAQYGFDETLDTSITFRIAPNGSAFAVLQQGDVSINSGSLTFGSTSFNADGLTDLCVGDAYYTKIENFKVGISDIDDTYRTGLANYYPCKYLDTSSGVLEYIPRFL